MSACNSVGNHHIAILVMGSVFKVYITRFQECLNCMNFGSSFFWTLSLSPRNHPLLPASHKLTLQWGVTAIADIIISVLLH